MKRIIAVMAALMFAAVLFNINVSAMSNDMTADEYGTYLELKRQFELDYLNLVGNYENGYITYEEFQLQAEEITERYNEVNTDENGVLNNIAKNTVDTVTKITDGIGNAVGTVGESVKEWIEDIFNDNKTSENVSTTDYKGYGAVAVGFYKNYGVVTRIRYCDYIVVTSEKFSCYPGDSVVLIEEYDRNGVFDDTRSLSSVEGVALSDYYIYTFYGDVRYEDGTQYPTNDEYVEQPTYNFDNNTDLELEELLNELLEELYRQSPDLSTMEGLLESIYYRLGTLDSDDDNALLSDINTAILALSNSNDETAAEIVSALCEVRDEIKNIETSGGDININFDEFADFEVPDELLNIDFDNLSDDVKEKMDDIVQLISTLLSKGVPMAAINGGLTFYQDIIFNSNKPQDISFDLTFNGKQYSFTILSTSFFSAEAAQALQIVKNFVSMVIGYAWVLSMRRKASSMMN